MQPYGGYGLIGTLWVRVDQPEHLKTVIATIDTLFRNSEAETVTETELSITANVLSSFDGLIGVVMLVDFRWVRMGQKAEVVPDAYSDRKYPAQVVKIYPQVDRQKGTVKVELKLAKTDEYLRPDMSVRINFLAESPKDDSAPQVLVSRAALRRNGGNAFVWTVRDGQVWRTLVQIGEDFGNKVEIMSGLDGGEALVVSGPENLREGMRVNTEEHNSAH